MTIFRSIEGLRGWLAWFVVLGHCIQATDLNEVRILSKIYSSGLLAVFVFVIVSGFVITHLLLVKKESYWAYITRRFLRLYPLFILACTLGAFALPFYVDALSHHVAWKSQAAEMYGSLIASQNGHFVGHLIAHGVMLHSAIPDGILPLAAFVFCPPAWSISLEWQFYLIAPLVILLATSNVSAFYLLGLCGLGGFLFFNSQFGRFDSAGFLPGAASLFAVGIGSRFMWSHLREGIAHPATIAAFALALTPLGSSFFTPVLFWIAFYAFVCVDRERIGGIDAIGLRFRDIIFENRVALFWGDRSYSVYLCHFPVLCVAVPLLANPIFTKWQLLGLVTLGTVTGTAMVSILTYRYVERPGIRFGHFLAGRLSASRGAPPTA